MDKTLLGKNDYIFLQNDSAMELKVHCDNLNLVKDLSLKRYTFNNFCIIVFPNKSLIYKDLLPDEYKVKYRPALDIYMNILNNKLIDTYNILKNEEDIYYKTDTHINIKGNYIVYKYFIQEINKKYNLCIEPKQIKILCKKCVLSDLNLGLGDLLWKENLGEQIIQNITDTFYYSNDIKYIYCAHIIQINDNLRILDKNLNDKNNEMQSGVLSWDVLSNYILFQKNISNNKLKVLIFYDSFLTSILSLYLELFEEVYMSKSVYDNTLIEIINPDYVFEFRVERFLF